MTTDAGLSHAQAHAFLHTGRRHLSGSEAKQLDAHLAACAECRAYAAYLTTAEPALAAALHTRWDAVPPALSERAFIARVRARAGHRRPAERPAWLAAAPLAAAVVVLLLAAVWIGGGGLNGLVEPGDGPQPTEVALPTGPAPTVAPFLTGAIIFSGFIGQATDQHFGLYALPAQGQALLVRLTPASHSQPAVGAAWSPDGAWFAYLGAVDQGVGVFIMRADGSDQRPVTPANETGWGYLPLLSWSPDGQWLAAARLGPGDQGVSIINGEIVLLAVDGSARLSFGPGISPKWSPDGTRLAYLRPGGGGMTLFTARPDGTDEQRASTLGLSATSAFDWLPDSSALTVIGLPESSLAPELRLVSPTGDSEQLLARLDLVANSTTRMHWSRAGHDLLFDARQAPTEAEPQPPAGLYRFNLSTRAVTLVLPAVAGDFSWSPDGRQFVAADASRATINQFALLRPDVSPLLVGAVPVPGVSVYSPLWQPDPAALAALLPTPAVPLPTARPGPAVPLDPLAPLFTRWLAFLVRTPANRDEIYLLRDDPGLAFPLGLNGQALPGETLTGHDLAWSPDGTQLAFVSDSSGRPRVYLWTPEFFQATPLTGDDPAQPAPDYQLAWSPDGEWLAVTALPVERGPAWAGGELYLLRRDTTTLKRFPADAPHLASRVTGPARWSPDGAWLAYPGLDANGLPALFALAMPADLTTLDPAVELPARQLTASAAAADGPHDIYLGYAWSPDSQRLAYLRQGPWVGASPDAQIGEGFHASIETVSPAEPDAAPVVLRDFPTLNGIQGLTWSPDGAYLLYLADAATNGCWSPYLLPTAGGDPLRLVGVCALTRTALPQWSADSRYLLFSTEAGLAVVDVPAALADPAHVTPMLIALPPDLPGLAHSPAWQRWP